MRTLHKLRKMTMSETGRVEAKELILKALESTNGHRMRAALELREMGFLLPRGAGKKDRIAVTFAEVVSRIPGLLGEIQEIYKERDVQELRHRPATANKNNKKMPSLTTAGSLTRVHESKGMPPSNFVVEEVPARGGES